MTSDSGAAEPSNRPDWRTTSRRACRNFLTGVADLCFPVACLSCGSRLPPREPIHFCAGCRPRIKLIASPCCPRCGVPFPDAAGGDHLCAVCLQQHWHFTRARAVLHYTEVLGRAVHGFKYRHDTAALASFTRLACQSRAWQETRESAELILPVPLHVRRLRERGFNQALLLARALFPDERQKIAPDLLQRTKWTPPQTGLSGAVRRRNLKNSFTLKTTAPVRARRVLLVDDVFTTGATADECARVLQRAGASAVLVFTLARVPN